ncbi:MAG TPA: Dam family site-specific DNA-(adenine-N6)-methyltransferase [Vicinamibacterales bacterium]|nr:Dam family site-specific DNA-(adenine-N6)-methyltransferase [Vicinamibacterales bacterium]
MAKPFLKWAGGKRQLLPVLREFYPRSFDAYLEPFVGSGAVFFDLRGRGLLDGHEVLLADSSRDLIDCYIAVRDHVAALIAELEALQAGHRAGGASHYYAVRDEQFNTLRRRPGRPIVPLAARLIYLNRTGYNGLFRVNAAGDFNVPVGRYKRPVICDAANLRAASAALAGVRLECAAFSESLRSARANDFVYLDPPYAPLSRTASFTAYTAAGFGGPAQEALRSVVVELAARGVRVLLSNSAADEVRRLYADDARAREAGLRAHRVAARRAINSAATRRGPVWEYVITNVGC